MKKMLVPVDFSETAENALNFAVQMAEWLKCEMVLFHVVYTPAFIADEYSQVVLPTFALQKDCEKELKKKCRKIAEKNDRLAVSHACTFGVPSDEILRFAEEHAVDLIVIGIQGVGYLTERLIGSTASAVIKDAACPVFVIDKKVAFKVPRKMVVAVDFVEGKKQDGIKRLKEFSDVFKAHVYLLHVYEGSLDNASEKRMALETALDGIDHSFCYSENDDPVQAINAFVEKLQMDLVVMFPRKRSLVNRIFHESISKKMAFHSLVPLLTLPER